MVVTEAIDHQLPLGYLFDGTSIIDIILTQENIKKKHYLNGCWTLSVHFGGINTAGQYV